MKIFFTVLILILLLPSVSAIVINEILPDPESDWNGNGQNETYADEWIELFNTGQTKNLTGWKIGDKVENYTLNHIICSGCFLVLFGSETSLQLNNNDETVYFYDNNSILIDSYSYSSSSDDLSFGRCPDGNASWQSNLNPTPGQANNCSQQQQEEKELNLDYPGQVECEEEFYIEIEASGFEDGDYDVKIDILSENDEERIGKVWNEEDEKWQSTNNYIIEILEIENDEGDVKLKYKIEDFEGDAILRPRIRKTGSSSYEQFDDEDIEVECNIQEESEIKILEWPTEARFGEEIKVEIEIYRGDTAKYAVYIYVQDNEGSKMSDKISLHADEKFQIYTETITLTLKCENEQGTYEIIAEGFDTEDRKEITIESCEPESEEPMVESSKTETTKTKTYQSSHSYPSSVESENLLINKTLPYILSSIALLLVIYLIIKKI